MKGDDFMTHKQEQTIMEFWACVGIASVVFAGLFLIVIAKY